ncbi:hypothetical protein AKJ65_01055 [candidate division MSBL1 archaeon SCGC-AAA259E19]|uniref:Probable dihydroorotate dehydrogenase B (NAD(+)), electron transfer subunit n=1 Tax=candidate division MSBL1 archaeon SCGC-AAA259E19 TaxID=1698264 RepID=A0A133UNA5_9EURY|nr:hypothetical protein AKJ65_01055 [candidate division MSBL1 archaeon SCGC-AAA259E19]
MEDSYRKKNRPTVLPLLGVVEEAPEIKSFFVNHQEIASATAPGQFLMLWVIGVDEIPMSVSGVGKDGTLRLTVEKVGDATSKLHELEEGDLVGVRGPYGNGFDISGNKFLIVCGGCGTAPLSFATERLVEQGKKATVVLAAETSEKLLFRSQLEKMDVDLFMSTEDGSTGVEGLATDVLEKEINDWDFDSCLVCGPERMMAATAELVEEKGISIQLSLNRYMKCGIGICGQCSMDPSGLRVCRDGPVFNYEEIKDSEFGDYKRNSEGKKVEI